MSMSTDTTFTLADFAAPHQEPNKPAEPKKLKQLHFLCFRPNNNFDFSARFVFSTACQLWFKEKRQLSIRAIREATGFHTNTVKSAMNKLVDAGLIEDGRPQFKDDVFWTRSDFRPKKWWKGIQYRKVHLEGNRCHRRNVLLAFLEKAKKGRATTSYLAACAGIDKKTAWRQLNALSKARRAKKEGDVWVPIYVTDEGGVVDANTFKTLKIKELLKGCYGDEQRKELGIFAIRNTDKFIRLHQFVERESGGKDMNWRHLLNLCRQHESRIAKAG